MSLAFPLAINRLAVCKNKGRIVWLRSMYPNILPTTDLRLQRACLVNVLIEEFVSFEKYLFRSSGFWHNLQLGQPEQSGLDECIERGNKASSFYSPTLPVHVSRGQQPLRRGHRNYGSGRLVDPLLSDKVSGKIRPLPRGSTTSRPHEVCYTVL